MKVHAWKVDARYTDRCKYYIQLNDIPGKRAFNRLFKEMKEEGSLSEDKKKQLQLLLD